MRKLTIALAAAALLAGAAPASARHVWRHVRHVSHHHHRRHAAWPVGWQNVPMENRGGACPHGDCELLATR